MNISSLPWIAISIVVLIGLVVMILIMRSRGEETEPDYRAFFIIGISLIPVGISTENFGLSGAGIVFMVLGLANRSKWNNQPKWSELSTEKRRLKFFLILGLVVLLALSFVAYALFR